MSKPEGEAPTTQSTQTHQTVSKDTQTAQTETKDTQTTKQSRNVSCFDNVEHEEGGRKYNGVFCFEPQAGGARLFRMRDKYIKL